MAYTSGFRWNGSVQKRLRELTLSGHTNYEISAILSEEFEHEISAKMIEQAKHRYRLSAHYLLKDEEVKIYQCLTLRMDDYMISCDYHSPFVSEEWINRLLFIADRFGIKKNIIIGDLFDFDFARSRKFIGDAKSLDKEVEHTEPVLRALDYFDENILITGNHERRTAHLTDDLIQARHLFSLFGAEIWKKKFKYSIYDKLYIGNNWMLVHPRSYRQTKTSVAQALAEKYHKNIINTHGHFIGSTFDRSGTYQCVDLGGMFDRKKISYINLQTTTHPIWNNGFGMMRNGKFWHFTDMSDWDYWLEK